MSHTDLNVECPHCGESFHLTQALIAPMLEAEKEKIQAEAKRHLARERAEIEAQAEATIEAKYTEEREATHAAMVERDAQVKAAKEAELAAIKAKEAAEQAQRDVHLQVAREVEARKSEIIRKATAEATAEAALKLQATEAALAAKDAKLQQAQEAELEARRLKAEAEQAQRDVHLQVAREVEACKSEIIRKAMAEATAEAAVTLQATETALAAKDAKLKQAQDAELEARRLKTEAEEAKRETELLVVRKLDEERTKVRDAAFKERDDEHRLKVAEKDKQLETLRDQIEELRRTGGNGSQQLAGDVLEVDTMEVLRQAFPTDRFERVPKGQSGADLLQTVVSSSGAVCGTILWETKRTKAWQNPWLSKLREDQRSVTADLAALATETLPAGVATFGQVDGVWVMSLATIIPVATALRHGLIDVATARRAGALADSTKDRVFGYLTTPAFRQRVSRIVEAYEEMRADLDKERKALTALWSKREKQLERVLGGVSGLYGDLQGIVGSSLPALESLELPGERPRLSVVGTDINPTANDLA